MLVHDMVTRRHDVPFFRFKASKDVTFHGFLCILPCTIQMKLEVVHARKLQWLN